MAEVTAPDHVGRRVRWHGQRLFCPPSRCQPGAPVVEERIAVAPDIMEVGFGVPIGPGDVGRVTDFLGVIEHNRCYRLTFTNGAVFDLVLPDDLADFQIIEIIADHDCTS